MRVRASSPDFWRGQTFDRWNGRVWTVSEDEPHLIRGRSPIGIPRVPADGPVQTALDVDELVQTYYLAQPGPNAIFAASQATKVYFPDRSLFQNQDGTLRAGVRLDPGAVYTVVSQRALTTPEALRRPPLGAVPDDIASQYAASPVTTDRVRALAHTITAGAPTTYDKVLALEQWLGEHTRYSLDIPRLPKGADAVDQYVFVDRKGFCEQIGTALVVMLRELGVPARLAVGYAPGERNPFTGLYEVKASDAHAWAEVYFPGVGWQGFDPTASVPLAGDAHAGGSWLTDARRNAVPLAITAALVVLLALATPEFLAIRRRRRARRASWSASALHRLERAGRKAGRARAPSETPREYAAALAEMLGDDRLTMVGATLDAELYSAHGAPEDDRVEADAVLTSLRP